MTRFEQEISGMLDREIAERKGTENNHYWERSAKAEVEAAVKEADEKATIDADGAIRWTSNGTYLMDDFCEKLAYAGYDFSREATSAARERQTIERLSEYRKQSHRTTAEEINEMRAAFGTGTKVVNILTGETIAI